MVTFVDIDSLPPSTLRHLAALREERDRSRYLDYEAMAKELAEMLCDGRKPTIGWYRRHLRPCPLPSTSPGQPPPAPPAT
jgi:hypothetical protein